MDKNILILGASSFAAQGLQDSLVIEGFETDLFFRGGENRIGDQVFGDVFKLSSNLFLKNNYHTIINFVIFKDSGVEANLKFIKELIKCCQVKKIKHLIQISSISVYPNESKQVDEKTQIESNITNKGAYSAIKVAVDNHLENISDDQFYVSFVRPGLILAKNTKPSLVGICKKIFLNNVLLLGNKVSTLPTIQRNCLHKAILNIISLKLKNSVYLILVNNTKYNLVNENFDFRIILLPKKITLILAKILFRLRIFNRNQYRQVLGLFKDTYFNSKHSEKILQMKFKV